VTLVARLVAVIFTPAMAARCGSKTVPVMVPVLDWANAENAARVVKQAVALMPRQRQCKCGSALEFAILTDPARIPAATRQKLALLLDKYLAQGQEAKA
jgi:5'-methylthioadenosine phosphorylase